SSKFTPFVSKSELKQVGKVAKGVTGTSIRYWPDPQIFTKGSKIDLEDVRARLRQTAFLVPGLQLTLNDESGESATSEVFKFDGGISEYVEFLSPDAAVTDIWRLSGTGHYAETVP